MALEKQYGEIILVQHGVKGQKWGARRARRAAVQASNQRAQDWTKKYLNRASMSTADLQKNVNRLNLENQFRDAVVKSSSVGQSRAKKWMSGVGKSVLSTAVNSASTSLLNAGSKYLTESLKSQLHK